MKNEKRKKETAANERKRSKRWMKTKNVPSIMSAISVGGIMKIYQITVQVEKPKNTQTHTHPVYEIHIN